MTKLSNVAVAVEAITTNKASEVPESAKAVITSLQTTFGKSRASASSTYYAAKQLVEKTEADAKREAKNAKRRKSNAAKKAD